MEVNYISNVPTSMNLQPHGGQQYATDSGVGSYNADDDERSSLYPEYDGSTSTLHKIKGEEGVAEEVQEVSRIFDLCSTSNEPIDINSFRADQYASFGEHERSKVDVNVASEDVDDDILDLVKACQDPKGYLDTFKHPKQEKKTSITLELSSEPSISRSSRTKEKSPVSKSPSKANTSLMKNLPCLGQKDCNKDSDYSGIYNKYKWAAFRVSHGEKSQHSQKAQRQSVEESGKTGRFGVESSDFASHVNALKLRLRELENQGSIVSLVNAVSMVQSLERFNWKSVLRLLDKNPSAGKDLLTVMNPKKKPIVGSALTPALKKANPMQVENLDHSLSVGGVLAHNRCFITRSVKSPVRQFVAFHHKPTPGEIALSEGKSANKIRLRKKKHKQKRETSTQQDLINLPSIPSPGSSRYLHPSSAFCPKPVSPNIKFQQRFTHTSNTDKNSNYLDIEGVQLPHLPNDSSSSSSTPKSTIQVPYTELPAPHTSLVSIGAQSLSQMHSTLDQSDSETSRDEEIDPGTGSKIQGSGKSFVLVPPVTPASPLPESLLTSQSNLHRPGLSTGDIFLSTTSAHCQRNWQGDKESDETESDSDSVSLDDLDPY